MRPVAWLVTGVAVVLYATLFPFDFHIVPGRTLGDVVADIDLTLLRGYVVTDVVVNVALFVPVGIGLAGVISSRWRSTTAAVVAVALAGGALLASAVEIVQGLSLVRYPSVTDVVANATGAAIGAFATARRGWWTERGSGARRPSTVELLVGRRVVAVCAGAFVVVMVGGALAPLATRPSGWDLDHPLSIGNERSGDRPWRGRVAGVYLMDRVATDPEARRLMDDPAALVAGDPAGFVVAHDFVGGSVGFPRLVRDGSGVVLNGASGIGLDGSAWLVTSTPPRDVNRSIERSSAFTLAVVAAPDGPEQSGPARIVSISDGLRGRNLTVGQEGRDLVVRIRTALTGGDGTSPELVVPGIFDGARARALVLRYDGVELVVGVDGDPAVHSIVLAPAVAALVAAFPLRTERLRLDTASPWVLQLTFAALVFAPIVIALRAVPIGPGWSAVVIVAAVGLNAAVRRSSAGAGGTSPQVLLLDLAVVAALWALVMPWSRSARPSEVAR